MKQKIFLLTAVLLVSLVGIQAASAAAPQSTGETRIVEETYIPIEDHTFDNMGWLGMRALPPLGFAGVVCVDVKNISTGEMQTVKLEYMDMYMGGQWLTAGDYAIEKAYIETGNHFLVESNETQVHIAAGTKNDIELVIRENPEAVEQFEKEHAAFTPKPPAETTEPAETTSSSEATVPTESSEAPTAVTEHEPTEDNIPPVQNRFAQGLIVLFAAALFALFTFGFVWLMRKSKEK